MRPSETLIEVAGERIALAYPSRSIIALEKSLGLTVGEIQLEFAEGRVSQRALVEMLWAGLLKAEPKVTTDRACDLFDALMAERGFLEAVQVVAGAFGKAFEGPGDRAEGAASGN